MTADRLTFNPGDSVTFTLTIRSPSVKVGGAFITTAGVGTLQALAGEGLRVNAPGLTHSAPKAAVNGVVTFRFGWQAPAAPGGLDILVAALAGNGDNASSGDAPGRGEFQWTFGCTAQTFYMDLDRDGYGSKDLGVRLGCSGDPPPTGYSAMAGDCDENNEMVHPGAIEICNMRDDDCNGQIDENAPSVMMWPDGDGDGFYPAQKGTPKMGCGNIAGYAAVGGDCNDVNPMIHPGATEICNNIDDNCNGDVDEGVRPRCGVGWCARYSPTCDPADCRPGPPAVETCNSFDDDCDGQDDNGACPQGMLCTGHACIPDVGPPATGGAAGVVDAGSSFDAGTVDGSGGAGGPASGGTQPTGGTGAGGRGGGQSRSGCAVAGSLSEGRPKGGLAGWFWSAATLVVCLGLGLRRGRKRPRAALGRVSLSEPSRLAQNEGQARR